MSSTTTWMSADVPIELVPARTVLVAMSGGVDSSVAAARLVEPGSAVGIGAGTTTWVLAQHLLAIDDLTVDRQLLALRQHVGQPELHVPVSAKPVASASSIASCRSRRRPPRCDA